MTARRPRPVRWTGPPMASTRWCASAAGRFPGFDVLDQAPHWDQVMAEVVAARSGPFPELKFFTPAEQACAAALLNLLTGQDEPEEGLGVPVLELIDARLAAGETDGWRYDDMPEDGQAWRDTLAYLDADAARRGGSTFADATEEDQHDWCRPSRT
jgi:Gluconate 2-dehydrogenase subunit 3